MISQHNIKTGITSDITTVVLTKNEINNACSYLHNTMQQRMKNIFVDDSFTDVHTSESRNLCSRFSFGLARILQYDGFNPVPPSSNSFESRASYNYK
jgi:hypothetical protein